MISTADLKDLLPHRPPMVWVDEVLEVTEDYGLAVLRLEEAGHYMDQGSGELRPSSLLELMAQTYGYMCAYQSKLGLGSWVKPPKVTFLAQIKNAEIASEMPRSGDLFTEVKKVREIGPLTLVSGTVKTSDGTILATAELKLYAE